MKIVNRAGQRLLIACTLLFSTAALAQTAPVKPEAFAYHTGVDLSANGGPFYQVALPLPVYQGVQRQDLGDLRVFNGQGETVPHTLIRAQSTSVSQDKFIRVPLFPITQSKAVQAADGEVALDVQRKADGTLIAVPKTAKPDKEVALVQGAILDISQIKERVRALHLEAGPSTVPFHAFAVETSDDLQQWHRLLDDAQLVHLQQGGQVIAKDTFEWDGAAGKYLRLVWREPTQAPPLTSASVVTTLTSFNGARMLWTEPIAATVTEANVYDYPVPGRLPLEQIRIGLPQTNTLAPLQVQRYVAPSPQRQHDAWETLTQTVVYRLQSPQGEVRSPDIELDTAPIDRLRLTVDTSSGGIGNGAPTLQVGFAPQTLVFLARGQGPFTLAWGSKTVETAAMPAATLLPNFSADKPLAASAATLQTIAAIPLDALPDSDKAPAKASKGVLWAVLVAGLLVLAGMVLMLLKQMRQGQQGGK